MKVLFTHSYFYKLDPKQWRFKQPYPPYGTMLAASVIRELGHNVHFLDNNLQDGPDAIVPVLEKEKPEIVVIYDDGFNYLTKMCLTVMRDAAFSMIRASKKEGCLVVVSGSDAADHHDLYFQNGVDYIIQGEGEVSLRELIQRLGLGDRENIPDGVVAAGISGHYKSRTVIRDLDTLPFPAWDLIDVESYRRIWKKYHGYFSLNMATTRGCPFKCNWCAKPIYGNRYTSRSPLNVIEEIEFLIKRYSPDHIWMADDIFGLKPGWVREFKEGVLRKKLKFKYKIQSRVDLLLEEDTLDSLVASGAQTVWVGAESGSQKILDAMDKGTAVGQIYEATKKMKEKGLSVGFFLQFGYLGETKDDIDATLRMVLELMPEEVGISVSYPLPGTKFYEKVKGQLGEKQNWKDSDDLSAMFRSTYSTAFYRELHRYVHAVYRKRKGYESWRKLFSSPFRLTRKELKSGLATFYYLPDSFVKRLKLASLQHESKN